MFSECVHSIVEETTHRIIGSMIELTSEKIDAVHISSDHYSSYVNHTAWIFRRCASEVGLFRRAAYAGSNSTPKN